MHRLHFVGLCQEAGVTLLRLLRFNFVENFGRLKKRFVEHCGGSSRTPVFMHLRRCKRMSTQERRARIQQRAWDEMQRYRQE